MTSQTVVSMTALFAEVRCVEPKVADIAGYYKHDTARSVLLTVQMAGDSDWKKKKK